MTDQPLMVGSTSRATSRTTAAKTSTAGDGRHAARRPGQAAAAILTVLDAPEPPLRLALGADAVDAIRAKPETLRADLDGWEELSRSTALD